MKERYFLLLLCLCLLGTSCIKEEDYPRNNKYDPKADVDRNYTLEFDHLEVINEEATDNVNGLLDVEEKATLRVFIKNNGPDPSLLNSGTFEDVPTVNGFYIFTKSIGLNGGFETGDSDELGYTKQYIDPGAIEYIDVDIRTYSYLDSDQDIACVFMLTDYDGKVHQVDFSVHVE